MTDRNPEYQFVSTDTNEMQALMIAAYEKITGVSVRPASPERLFIQWVADIILQERVLNNYTGNQNLPSRAAGENLDALGQLFYDRTRPPAQPAVCTVRFRISAAQSASVLIPAGTRVTDVGGALVWETVSDAYIPIGSVFADVAMRCQTDGVIGNGYAAGQINKLVDISNILYYDSCENVTASGKGADAATDGEYYSLMRASQDAYSDAGARGAYIYFAKRVSTEIADVVANSPLAGQVSLYVLMRDGTAAGSEIKDAVYAACSPDTVRPLTDYVVVDDPETVDYDIKLTYYIQSDTAGRSFDIEANVTAAVGDYITWQCGKLGRDINPDELRQRVKETGIKRIVLDNPVFTVLRDGNPPAGAELLEFVPQIARIGAVSIVNGGYEDE